MEKNPLIYFTTLLKSTKINSNTDKEYIAILENYHAFIEFQDKKNKIVKYWKPYYDSKTDDSVEGLTTFNYRQNLSHEVSKNNKITKSNIDKLVTTIVFNGNKPNAFLILQINNLNELLVNAKKTIPSYEFIVKSLEDIIDYIVDKYSLKTTYKNKKLNIPKKYSFFDLKENVKMSVLTEIYDISIELNIIDDEIVMEDTFINILSGNPTDTDDFIIFKSNNQISTLFFKCIQPIFHNFSFSQISKSKSFFNKQEKLFNQADLDNANLRLKKNTSFMVDKVITAFAKITKR